MIGLDIARALMPLRKEIGILAGMLALVHGLSYILGDPSYILDSHFWINDGYPTYTAYGFVAWIIMILLLLTSNLWSMKFLGPRWKMLHRTVYVALLFVVAHVVAVKYFFGFEYGPVILLVVYCIGKVLEWRGVTLIPLETYPPGQKWLCIPCGYIYDPAIGDEDSGIPP